MECWAMKKGGRKRLHDRPALLQKNLRSPACKAHPPMHHTHPVVQELF